MRDSCIDRPCARTVQSFYTQPWLHFVLWPQVQEFHQQRIGHHTITCAACRSSHPSEQLVDISYTVLRLLIVS